MKENCIDNYYNLKTYKRINSFFSYLLYNFFHLIKNTMEYFIEGLKFIISILISKPALIIYAVSFSCFFVKALSLKDGATHIITEKNKFLPKEVITLNTYEYCMSETHDTNLDVKTKIKELNNYINSNYPNTSVMYYDLKSNMQFSYNESEIYYGASLIKTLEALYIYEKAVLNPGILDQELIYTSNFIKHHSLGMEEHKVGDKVSIKKLVSYSIIYSDNTAHAMLSNYIGFNNLKEYGNNVGNKYALFGGDTYGNVDLNGAFNYMKRLNDFINNNGELGKELKSYFNNNYFNYLNLEDANVIHKYGKHDIFFHDTGIVENKNPYIVVILTKYGLENREIIVNNISKKIKEFHDFYSDKKQEICDVY